MNSPKDHQHFQNNEEIKISTLLKTLLKWSKEENPEFSPKKITELLRPIFGCDVGLHDAVSVFFKAYEEAWIEPRFELNKTLAETLLSFHKYPIYNIRRNIEDPNERHGLYVEDTLKLIMGNLRCARTDWCSKELK